MVFHVNFMFKNLHGISYFFVCKYHILKTDMFPSRNIYDKQSTKEGEGTWTQEIFL